MANLMAATYDDRQKYRELCDRVARINQPAAQWMRIYAVSLVSFEFSDNIMETFAWEDTPQGLPFWAAIYNSLRLSKNLH